MLCQPILTSGTFRSATPFGHLLTHVASGLPLNSNSCLCFECSPYFHPGSRQMPGSLTPAACLYLQLKGLHSWRRRGSWKPDVLRCAVRTCGCLCTRLHEVAASERRIRPCGHLSLEPEWCAGHPR